MTKQLIPYFCLICGVNVFTTDLSLEKHMTRKDGIIAINLLQRFFWINMKRHITKYVRQEIGVQQQYGWKCPQCTIQIGYTCITHQQFQELINYGKGTISNKPFFYLINGSVNNNMDNAKLFQQLSVHRDSVNSHIRRQQSLQAPFKILE